MGVAGGRFVGLGADAEPPAPYKHGGQELVSIAQRHFVSFHSEICVSFNFNTCVCNQHLQGVRRLVRRVGYGDGSGFARHEQEACQ